MCVSMVVCKQVCMCLVVPCCPQYRLVSCLSSGPGVRPKYLQRGSWRWISVCHIQTWSTRDPHSHTDMLTWTWNTWCNHSNMVYPIAHHPWQYATVGSFEEIWRDAQSVIQDYSKLSILWNNIMNTQVSVHKHHRNENCMMHRTQDNKWCFKLYSAQ